ncbi:hypothetical protein [Mangrovicoccus sp. HB161399]|uniref:helix-turn-helix transcriptional regulator n=1 Tax=Mangrovicoccus sp. HB161399 TaxID=2720392 RepID=UPI001551A08D|nr:hypothetical protein [Mangrovicoccus sp. HB161399]
MTAGRETAVRSRRRPRWAARPGEIVRRLGLIGAVGLLQAGCAAFFLSDVLRDISAAGFTAHLDVELAAALALVAGSLVAFREVRAALRRAAAAERSRQFLSGAFGTLFRERCDAWNLTPAERDVALLLVKGFDPAEIAAHRGTALGTVRAQLARVYGKSGHSGRGQFVSVFIDDLLDIPDPEAD